MNTHSDFRPGHFTALYILAILFFVGHRRSIKILHILILPDRRSNCTRISELCRQEHIQVSQYELFNMKCRCHCNSLRLVPIPSGCFLSHPTTLSCKAVGLRTSPVLQLPQQSVQQRIQLQLSESQPPQPFAAAQLWSQPRRQPCRRQFKKLVYEYKDQVKCLGELRNRRTKMS